MKRKTKIFLYSSLALLLIGALVCAIRWKAWFGQPPELPYDVSPTPWRVLLTFGNDGQRSRIVSWQCDSVLRPSFLEWKVCDSDSLIRIPAMGEVFRSRAGQAAYYHASINDFQPGSCYCYRVFSGDDSSEWFHYEMPQEHENFSFLFFGDIQDPDGTDANRLLLHALQLNRDAEFVVFGGDFAERPRDADWQQAFAAIDSIGQSLPILDVPGNHDYLKSIPAVLERRFPLIFPYFLSSSVEGSMVYALRYGDAEIFLLDSFREYPYLRDQAAWLSEKLKSSDARWKIVVMHHPLYSVRGKSNKMLNWAFRDIIEDNGVDLVLSGHEHNYARLKSPNNQHTIYTISHCSPKTYDHSDSLRFQKFDSSRRYAQKIEVSRDSLVVVAYAFDPDTLIDRFVIAKP